MTKASHANIRSDPARALRMLNNALEAFNVSAGKLLACFWVSSNGFLDALHLLFDPLGSDVQSAGSEAMPLREPPDA